jgi:hypothetical protein
MKCFEFLIMWISGDDNDDDEGNYVEMPASHPQQEE